MIPLEFTKIVAQFKRKKLFVKSWSFIFILTYCYCDLCGGGERVVNLGIRCVELPEQCDSYYAGVIYYCKMNS